MIKKKLKLSTLGTISLLTTSLVATSCNNTTNKNYQKLVNVSVKPEIKKSKEAKDVLTGDIIIEQLEGVTIEVTSVTPSNLFKDKLIINLVLTEENGKSVEIIKEINGFKIPKISTKNQTEEANDETRENTELNNKQEESKLNDVNESKGEKFNLQTYVNSFESVTLDDSIKKDATPTSSITKENFVLGEFDKKIVNVEITDGRINEANASEYIITLTFKDLVNEGINPLTKDITFGGFKVDEQIKHYSNEKIAKLAKEQKLFVIDSAKIKDNLENFEKAVKGKKPLIKVIDNKITYVDTTIKDNIVGISLNPDLEVNSLTHGGRNKGTYVKPYPRVGNYGGIRIVKDENGSFKLQFNLILEDHVTVDDVVYEQFLFTIN
ncbi:hypothetical protein [Mycoplasma zalophidermidis]|uniref:hypothetical protein n=1 Tax=Mycoplasma zalophidermidis TaxID=398174 RepID=UPI00215BB343|nr:hypothetical protein [Mycoplasma zalophidermidis]MCR8966269.1 hypothetical protein [Mycoplasma zalophidermidis]